MEGSGLEVRVVEPLVPKGEVTIIAERFVDTWTKLAVFDFTEYDVSRAPGWIGVVDWTDVEVRDWY